MIRHFLKRDFKDYQLYWVLVFSVAFMFGVIYRVTGILLCLYLAVYTCVFLAFLPVNYLTGVTWRAQHIMSRNYLLALPIGRKKLFHMVLVRILVFWTPLWGLLFYLPVALNRNVPYRLNHPGAYVLLVLIGSFWLINAIIAMQLRYEEIIRYMHVRQRISAWTRMLAGALGESLLMALALFSLHGVGTLLRLTTLAAAIWIAIRRYRSNLRRWI